MMRDRDDLETERVHVMRKARLDDFSRINAFFQEMREALLKKAANCSKNLKIVCDCRIV
jgi:hypothetical protein